MVSSCTINDLRAKDPAIILSFTGGQGFQRRMRVLGIREGKAIHVLTRHPWGGPVVVNIDHRIITIGKGMARHIIVKRK